VPRPAQKEILSYTGGPMGVSAVPGSGKTFTLSLLAARLVERLASTGRLDDREVLVVTFTNSAVENFRSRIGNFLREERGLLPGVGYRVRTLHGLAHDIVRERPALVGLSESFDIVDERTAADIKRDAVLAYLRTHPDFMGAYILPDYLQNFRRIERYVLSDALEIANSVIRVAKELRSQPHELHALLDAQSGAWPLLEFGLRIFADYQRSLFMRGAVDFDDLIVLALQALDADPDFCERLQERWPYVLEDEAQDSSALQEEMLRGLTAAHGNWVRVGDPNQAINTTFTSADIRFLREFLERYPDGARELPNSGRCAQPIIDTANHLIEWSSREHPVLPPAKVLAPPHILPTPPGDPQPNPAPGTPPVYVFDRALTPEEEVNVVVASVKRWLPTHADATVAVLTPENNRGFRLVEALEKAGVPFDDSLLRSDSATRAAARALATVVSFITQPQTATQLERVWSEVWVVRNLDWRPETGDSESAAKQDGRDQLNGRVEADSLEVAFASRKSQIADLPEPIQTFGKALRQLREPESFLFPGSTDWLDSLSWLDEAEGFREMAEAFRADLQRWTAATVLPPDELLLSLGNDLFTKPADLALTHRLAVLLAKLAQENPTWRLPELAGELENIAQNKRRILGFTEEGLGFEPKPGQVTVATMHAAKGLEWDRVYLMGVNNFSFPSGSSDDQHGDKYRGERWYVRDGLNLVEEGIAQLRLLHKGSLDGYGPGPATAESRQDVAAERLRLLYVGITRARCELILTYNTGRNPERDPNEPALAFQALGRFVQENGLTT
jgi:DNA helicase-2/ATP-dependent DNA helicase PcrA